MEVVVAMEEVQVEEVISHKEEEDVQRRYLKVKRKSRILRGTLHPEFSESFRFPLGKSAPQDDLALLLEVCDKLAREQTERLTCREAEVPLANLFNEERNEVCHDLLLPRVIRSAVVHLVQPVLAGWSSCAWRDVGESSISSKASSAVSCCSGVSKRSDPSNQVQVRIRLVKARSAEVVISERMAGNEAIRRVLQVGESGIPKVLEGLDLSKTR
eukprot:614382-Hanusia_phi.AAC.1